MSSASDTFNTCLYNCIAGMFVYVTISGKIDHLRAFSVQCMSVTFTYKQ